MKRLSISIAMCTYNGARFVQEQLDSVAWQTWMPDEMVVGDDRSRDETLSILQRFSQTAPFPVYLYQNGTRLGSSKNFEEAIKRCRGDVIVLADQDDVWKPQKLERLATALQENPEVAYVFSDANVVNEGGVSLRYALWEAERQRRRAIHRWSKDNQLAILLKRHIVTGATMAFQAFLKSLILPIPAGWIQDQWIALLGSLVSFGLPVPECLILYRKHASQQLGIGRRAFLEQCGKFSPTPGDYLQELEKYRNLKNRFLLAAIPCPPEKLNLLEQKIAHLSRRAMSRSSRGFSKGRMVALEALTGRYQRFSNSWLSIARDLCS